jgi:hypothetical protein
MRNKISLGAALAAATIAFSFAAAPAAHATSLEAVYGIRIGGFPVGTADVVSSFDGSKYSISLQARLTGLVGVFLSGKGAANASGAVSGNRIRPSAFAVRSESSRASRTVRMGLRGGRVAAIEIEPPLKEYEDRIPVANAHKRDVVDPVSAFLLPATVRGELTDPRNCERTIPVFDGASRFDITLSYGGTREMSMPGYTGPVLVCNARFKAISGHRPEREAIKYMEQNREMSVWLAPIESNRTLLPLRVEVQTQIGMSVIEASRINLGSPPRRAALD